MTVLVPHALNTNGLTSSNLSKLNNPAEQALTPTSINSQIVWVPKTPPQSQPDGHQGPPTLSQASSQQSLQPPPLFSRIKQLNFSQVDF